MPAHGRDDLEQAILNNMKAARTIIRLRHSILADEELNAVLPRLRNMLEAQAQSGSVIGLSEDELKTLLLGGGF